MEMAHWCIIFIGVIACLSISSFFSEIGNIQTIISYNYEGEKNDPNGKNMDVSMIKSPIVLDQVVHALELNEIGLSSDDLEKISTSLADHSGKCNWNIKRLENINNIDSLQAYIYYQANTSLISEWVGNLVFHYGSKFSMK